MANSIETCAVVHMRQTFDRKRKGRDAGFHAIVSYMQDSGIVMPHSGYANPLNLQAGKTWLDVCFRPVIH
jgi:hypothetical protein